MKTTSIALWLCLIPMFLCAQGKFEIGPFLGVSSYHGDLSPSNGIFFPEVKPTFGIINRIQLSNNFNLRNNLIYSQISGADANFDDINYVLRRDASFETTLFEASIALEWEFISLWSPIDSLGRRSKKLSPYLFAGLGGMYHSPKLESGNLPDFTSELLEDMEADVSPMTLVIPFGGGVNFYLSKYVKLRIESGIRYTSTDYVDGLSAAGNPNTNDWVWFGGVNLGFSFALKDSDKDGVPDKEDTCPWIAGSPLAKGCPDADNDGVEDAEDLCPDETGLPELNGCPDTDGDGIADLSDGCPLEFGYFDTDGCPDRDNDCVIDSLDLCPDVEGLAIYDGCTDTDNDSIPDHLDTCPDDPGLAANNGCPFPDTDCDGVLDIDDQCPDVASAFGFSGCPDSDEDGLPDKDDKCPAESGPEDNFGCPVLADTATTLLTEATGKIKYRSGRSTLLSSSKESLDQIAELLKTYPNYRLIISGYTDDRGKEASNLKLSKSRAKACFDYIIEKGISPERLEYDGFGEANPVGDNATAAGRELNRRVEFEMELNIEEDQE